MRILIEEADEFLQWNLKYLSLKDAECECAGDGHVDPCERCEAHETGKYTPYNIFNLIIGVGASVRQGLAPDRYRQAILGRSDGEIVRAFYAERALSLQFYYDHLESAFMDRCRADDAQRAAQACSNELYLFVVEREKAECLIAGGVELLKIRPVKGLRRRLHRLRRRIRRFDEIHGTDMRLLIAINDTRRQLREPIIVKNDW